MKIAITRADGGVSIMTVPADQDAARHLGEWRKLHRGEYVSHAEIDPTAIPADRAFRNAWTVSGGKIEHDMAKARALHLARLRAERNAALAATDGLILKASETGDEAERARLATLRQGLRDMPANVAAALAAAKDADALKAVRPAVLDSKP